MKKKLRRFPRILLWLIGLLVGKRMEALELPEEKSYMTKEELRFGQNWILKLGINVLEGKTVTINHRISVDGKAFWHYEKHCWVDGKLEFLRDGKYPVAFRKAR